MSTRFEADWLNKARQLTSSWYQLLEQTTLTDSECVPSVALTADTRALVMTIQEHGSTGLNTNTRRIYNLCEHQDRIDTKTVGKVYELLSGLSKSIESIKQ